MQPLEIRRIRVRQGKLDVESATRIDCLHVDGALANAVLQRYPNLRNHACVNKSGNASFGAELVGTELAHLLEHLSIELQAQHLKGLGRKPPLLAGHTSWLDELQATAPHGYALMRTTVSFVDDVIALRAVKEAASTLNEFVSLR